MASREGLRAIQKEVSRGGKTFEQTFWVKAEALKKYAEQRRQTEEEVLAGLKRAKEIPKELQPHVDSQKLVEETLKNKGFSVAAVSEIVPKDGFMVAVEGNEQRHNPKEFSPQLIDKYVADRADIFMKDPDAHVGGWYDEDNDVIALDVSHRVVDRAEGEKLGRERKQEGIYDVKRGKTIWYHEDTDDWRDDQPKKRPSWGRGPPGV